MKSRSLHVLSFLVLCSLCVPACADANWLLGGVWVDRNLDCPAAKGTRDIRPRGMVFSQAGLRILAPPVPSEEQEARFIARYDIDGGHIVAHLSQPTGTVKLDLPFDAVEDGLIRDLNGYIYRRCPLPADEPVS